MVTSVPRLRDFRVQFPYILAGDKFRKEISTLAIHGLGMGKCASGCNTFCASTWFAPTACAGQGPKLLTDEVY